METYTPTLWTGRINSPQPRCVLYVCDGSTEAKKVLNAAMQYRAMGLSIIPVGKDKKPFIKWEEFQKHIVSEDEIKLWFQKWPNANIGIVTGIISGMAIIDIDEPEQAKPVLDTLIPDSLIIPSVSTPRGGQHLYFRCADHRLSNNTKVIPGCDLRANGGYVVAPPSVNSNGKAYAWLEGLSIHDVELPPLPDAVVSFFKNASSYKNNNSLYREAVTDLLRMFEKGRRDNDLFHVATHLVKSRMPEQEIYQVLERLAASCNPPFDLKEIPAKIESALKRIERREVNITEELERWVIVTNGDFSVTDCYNELQNITGVTKRNSIRVLLNRLKDRGVIERTGKKDGVFRRVETQCEDIDFLSAPSTEFDIRYPFNMENYVKTHPGNIIVVAGAPNSGKTAFLLNVVEKNMDRHDVVYFSSEMGAVELRDRLSKFKIPLESWRFSPKERSSNFADVIRPDSINIIDFLELHEDFWKVGGMIKEIFDKLNKGIAIIALQKNPGASMGRGGVGSLEKPRLYLTMDNHKIRIEKGKNWANPQINPNGLEAEYKLVSGCEFITTKPWSKGK